MGRAALGPLLDQPSIRAFWWPRFERIADWFLVEERKRREVGRPLATEVKGKLVLPAPGGAFTLKATADRIDRVQADKLAVIDYKTGQPPGDKDVRLGKAPQLPLEALIAREGGFQGIPAAPVAELAFWHLTGGEPAGVIKPLKDAADDLADEARDGLLHLIALFDDEATPYRSQPRPSWAPRYTDYAHLARVAEWSAGGGEGGE